MAKVLLIEDEHAMRQMYATMLKTDGHEVLEADKGMDGYTQAINNKPDIVFLDFRLPDTNGLAILKMLTENTEFNSPVIILTNYAGDVDADAIKAAGATAILLKYEVTPSMLVEKTREFIGKK